MAQHPRLRRSMFALGDSVLLSLAFVSALVLATPDINTGLGSMELVAFLGLVLAIKIPLLLAYHMFDVHWMNVDIRDIIRLALTMLIASLVLAILAILIRYVGNGAELPLRAVFLDYLIGLLLLSGFRVYRRAYRDWRRSGTSARGADRRVLIVGAGSAGEQLARGLREEVSVSYEAAGFMDDDPSKLGTTIHGVRVIGPRARIPQAAASLRPDELWVAMPSAPGAVVRETVALAREAGIRDVKVVPGLGALLTGRVQLSDMQQADTAALLGREVVRIDTDEVRSYLQGRIVLVTGAAGSIGSELCKQVSRFNPSLLVLLDQDETGLYNIQNVLTSEFPRVRTAAVVADVRDAPRINRIFREHVPQVVFHAAAYKHVPLMEQHPEEAISTNVFGTRTVARAAVQTGADRFVFISTDKAVNPSSIMGATKRAAEVLTQEMNRLGQTRFVSVRFGNVLGSRGSVVPLFREQIARGGPVTVTDPEMKRYFMITAEAVLLVLQAGAIGHGGEVFVLDMGEPVKILDLARQLIKLSGFEPDTDIPIVFTGSRPGEKLFEDILSAEEGTSATRHDRIFVAKIDGVLKGDELQNRLEALESIVYSGDRDEIIQRLRDLVSTFQPSESRRTPDHVAVMGGSK